MDKERARFILDCDKACSRLRGCHDNGCPNADGKVGCSRILSPDNILKARKVLGEE